MYYVLLFAGDKAIWMTIQMYESLTFANTKYRWSAAGILTEFTVNISNRQKAIAIKIRSWNKINLISFRSFFSYWIESWVGFWKKILPHCLQLDVEAFSYCQHEKSLSAVLGCRLSAVGCQCWRGKFKFRDASGAFVRIDKFLSMPTNFNFINGGRSELRTLMKKLHFMAAPKTMFIWLMQTHVISTSIYVNRKVIKTEVLCIEPFASFQ